jgi:hypothetical protein
MRTLRTLLALFALVPLGSLGSLWSLRAADQPATRPNILHIHADDHRPDGLHELGNPLLVTPNLDTLVERGMTFTRAYTMGSMVGAVCTPSRSFTSSMTRRRCRSRPRSCRSIPSTMAK